MSGDAYDSHIRYGFSRAFCSIRNSARHGELDSQDGGRRVETRTWTDCEPVPGT